MAGHSVVADVDLWVFLALLLSCLVVNIRPTVHIPTLLMLAGLLLRTLGRYVGAVKSAVEVMDSIEAETMSVRFRRIGTPLSGKSGKSLIGDFCGSSSFDPYSPGHSASPGL